MIRNILICLAVITVSLLPAAYAAEDAVKADGEKHLPENLGNDPIEVVIVELKN